MTLNLQTRRILGASRLCGKSVSILRLMVRVSSSNIKKTSETQMENATSISLALLAESSNG